ncbi:hypothetical protein SAMN05421676_11214 [Salinibacillus kushneri]|uniref:Uncharacterized protein n=2 Tax=Salinibacillus kushneri TaxID=237682 RepID=A0A1I0ID65_9BACI|nr:hypothetical protein SAMN05421676_11214 [Salinibacillus kushneri]
MKVKMNTETVYKGKRRIPGETYDVDTFVGKQWIKKKVATEVKGPAKKTSKESKK